MKGLFCSKITKSISVLKSRSLLLRVSFRELHPAYRLHLIHEVKYLFMHLDQSCPSTSKFLITPYLTLHLTEKTPRDDAQPRSSPLAGTHYHAAVEFALSTFASWFSTLALELIDRSFDHRLIGKKGLNKLPDLISESNKRLSKLTEFTPVCSTLYSHYYISIQIFTQNARKKWISSKKFWGLL